VSSSQPAPGASREDRARQRRTAKREGQRASQQLAEVALALHLVRRDELVVEGRRRLAELASWDPHGDSGIHGNHLVARDMLWGLAALYDALYKDLDGDERRRAVDSIIARAADVHSEFLASGKMARQARNSHGWVAWAGAAAAIALVAGDDPRAEKLFLDLVPPFVTSISPWGGAPGGYGNGTGYGLWDVASLIAPFDIIGQAIGIDLYRKPWLAHVPRFFTYFLPPGAPEAPFGDAAEMPPDRNTAWTLRALSQRTNDPLVRWAAGQADPPAGGAMPLILSALRDPLEQPPLPPATPNSAYFEDVGWVAMHSALADRKRVSVYFKSSPYGSHNHSHADQNAIVVQAGGRALLKSSGYYDFYGSDHFKAWYQSTRASNAITFDGGKGQAQLDLNAKGRIVAFRSAPAYDVAVGDATQAYGGQLKQALRTVVYLRPDVVIVHDRLGSATARRWEWNVHADNRFEGDARAFRLESGPQSLCIDVLQAPPVRLDQQSGFQTPPRSSGKNATYTDQYHASLVSTNPSNEAEFVVALRISCTGKTPEIVREGSAWLVSVPDASRTVRLQGEQTEVR